jgi:type II secretory pathway pseudopilin PulG
MRLVSVRLGFSRTDLIVVLGLLVVVIGIGLPALAQTQEAAKRSRCQQNLQTLSAAIQQYADANDDYLPDAHRFKTPLRGWVTLLLPYLGEQKIYSQYDWERDWFHPNNQALASKRLDLLLCPSTPNPDRPLTGEISGTTYKVAAADYVATHGFTDALPLDEKRKRCEITDGLATTLLLTESSGRPQVWRNGQVDPVVPPNDKNAWAAWNGNYVRGHSYDGRTTPGPCAINCTNNNTAYSFHPGGAFGILGDGSVRFLSKDLDVYVFYALVTREGGETIADTDF